MFEGAELGRKVSKEDFKAEIPELRTRLLAAQRRARAAGLPVVVVVAGVDGAGKGEVVNRLNAWLDTRGVQVHAFWDATDEECQRPCWWRFWRRLPKRGGIAVLFGAWYGEAMRERLDGKTDDAALDAELARIGNFERMLTEDGALFIKFWFHLPAEEQSRRLKTLAKDPKSRWRMAPDTPVEIGEYPEFLRVAERVIRETDSGQSPWYFIESTDRRYRDLTVGRTLLAAIEERLERDGAEIDHSYSHAPHLPEAESAQVTVLDHVDLARALEKQEYKHRLEHYQDRLRELTWRAYREKRSCVLVFEGWDAGGKGGTIRRLMSAIDARLYRVLPVAAPTDEERAHHYLWRFWRQIPRDGRVTVFDRSWYGRVLVERVEGFASDAEWRRAYQEINEFEQQLVDHGTVLAKFWLHISPEEQLARFKAREETAYKRHKITAEDWRNREKWDTYKAAVNEMVVRTSTEFSEWTLVPANDKRYARVDVIRTVCERLAAALGEDED